MPPPPWTNQDLVLYHGTTDDHIAAIQQGIDVAAGRRDLDLGRGFYTTTLLQQARNWAYSLSSRRAGRRPTVIRLVLPRQRLAVLDSLWFVRGRRDADDYWILVRHCRRGGDHRRAGASGWYDVVAGPVAASLPSRAAYPNYDQLSFHTRKAEVLLNEAGPEEVQ